MFFFSGSYLLNSCLFIYFLYNYTFTISEFIPKSKQLASDANIKELLVEKIHYHMLITPNLAAMLAKRCCA